MSPIEWLCDNAWGFKELAPEERDAIMHFSLLWSYFEAKAMDNHACVSKIVDLAQKWEKELRLNVATFDENITYFKERYFSNGTATDHFVRLRFGSRDKKSLVEAVFKDESTNNSDRVAAVLIVVYRLRNNLFHGIKWASDLRGQLENFRHANAVLMSASEIAQTRRAQIQTLGSARSSIGCS
jgi:hypothetical protein